MPGLPPKLVVTTYAPKRRVITIVLLPVLKDHGSAGCTGALKNSSYAAQAP